MIELCDTVLIETSPETVWMWLAGLPGHYREWHPAHVGCWYERGSTLEIGAVLCIEEILHGRTHRMKLRATEVVPNRVLQYSSWGIRGAFFLEATESGTRFTATLSFGVRVPLIGQVADRLLGGVFAARLAEMQQHMQEEGRNLKRLLEHEHAA